MEEAIVSLAIERISDLLFQEAVYLRGVREQVKRLKAELERMNSFLKDADSKQKQTELHRTLVRQIRDVAYDAEDVMDTFVLKVAHQGGFHGITKRFTSIFTKPFHLHKIGVQVKAIQTMLEDISKCLPVYDKISRKGEESSFNDKISCKGEESTSDSRMQQQQRLRRAYTHVEQVVVGLQDMTKIVLARLMTEEDEEEEKEDRPHVVSIAGMGGIGKSTLAKKVYKHDDVRRHFDCFAWAFVSQKCMPKEVFYDVLIKVHSPKEEREQIDKMPERKLIKRLYQVLKEKKYLVVLDDIWRSEDWNCLRPAFPQGKKGSKILFTTRNKDVALRADPRNSPIELPLLTDDQSWELFKRKAFPRNTTESDAGLGEFFETLGRKLVKKCGGLPLAIVALGGLLATKKSPAQWEMVQRNMHARLNEVQLQDHQNDAVKGILVLSYNDLPYYLKPCFLYLGHYPEDWEISKKELIRLWIAEGFISPSVGSREMLMEDVAEQFLEELINRCLVQVSKRDRTGLGVKTCYMHDLLRDLCVEKAQEENFLEIIQPKDVTLSASMSRRIAIHPTKRYVSLKGKHPQLRSLLLFQNEKLIKLHISICQNFKNLRVLRVVERTKKEWRVSSGIGNLHHLRYLELENPGKIILPRSFGKLKSLHTLHVQSFGLTINLKVLFNMERLRHILLFDYDGRFPGPAELWIPPRITSKNIETLKYIGVENLIENNAVFGLANIQSLGIFFRRSKDVKTILKALVELHRLRSLDMRFSWDSWDSRQSFPNLEPLSGCHHLSKLFLDGKIEEDPQSMHHVLKFVPANIAKLTLVNSGLKQDPMPVLEKLPHLRTLRLCRGSYKGTKMICSANEFLQLDSLEIKSLPELEEWEIEEGAMPCLRSLSLFSLNNLRMIPEGLRYITALQEMGLRLMNRSLVERIQVIDGREGEDFSKVSHIPSIQIFHTVLRQKTLIWHVC